MRYVLMLRVTSAGTTKLDGLVKECDDIVDHWSKQGGTCDSIDFVLGEFDAIAVGSLPNEMAAMSLATFIVSAGWFTVTTAVAMTPSEFANAMRDNLRGHST